MKDEDRMDGIYRMAFLQTFSPLIIALTRNSGMSKGRR